MTKPEDDVTLVRQWLQRLQLHVQSVDFVGTRALLTEGMITFGSFNPFTVSTQGEGAMNARAGSGAVVAKDGPIESGRAIR